MKKTLHFIAAGILAILVAFSSFAFPQQAQAAPQVKTVTISSPVKVKTGKTGKYTLYQVKGKKASFKIKAKANSGKLKYKTSNKKIVTVSSKGVVKSTGKKTGKATITVYSAKNKKIVAKIKVTVKNFAPKLAPTKLTLQEGATGTLKVSGTGLKSTTYKSSNTKVATVSKKGVVTAVAEGTAKITATATAKSGVKKTLTATVTVKAAEVPVTKDTIDYAKVPFDYAADIAKEKAAVAIVPQAADIDLTAEDANGASGVVLVGASDTADTENYYLNAYVAGSTLKLAGKGDVTIASANSSLLGDLVVADGKVAYVLSKMDAADPVDEVLTITMSNDKVYKIHTLPEMIPDISITGEGVAADDAGIYTFVVDKFCMRVDTDGKLIYYRDLNCTGHSLMAEGFAPQVIDGKTYFSAFVELRPEFRNAQGGYSSGMYLVMDENYKDIDQLTLFPNEDPNHTHGEGYLDQHEFVMIGENHYLLLSYTLHEVNNLPKSLKGIDGTSRTYVWAGIMQEVKDGKVVAEINTADYPLLYESAVEKNDYEGVTLDGVDVVVGQNTVHSFADGIMDYVHVNSLDYTLDADGTVDKLLVSMRDQSAVYQFDMDTAAIDWILGGKASSLTGFEAYTSDRKDDKGADFKALTFGQHFARYANRKADGTIDGNPEISVFDNQTGTAPFLANPPAPVGMYPTLTRTFKATIDESANTAVISNVIDGLALSTNGKYHIASHCGSVQYDSATSVTIGWGLHGVIDNIGAFAPQGTIQDAKAGFDDLRQGSRPIFTDYNEKDGTISFELSVTRNPKYSSPDALFSYRTYKTPAEPEVPVTKDTIDYAKVPFDYAADIAKEKAEVTTLPQAADIDLTAEDANGATGAFIVGSLDAADTENFYLNTYVADSALILAGKGDVTIASANSSVAGDLTVADGKVSYVLPKMDANEPEDEILTVTMSNDKVYKIHTLPEAIPDMTITGEGVAADDAGVYTVSIDKFMMRINSEGKLIYYRDLNCVGHTYQAEGFAPQVVNGKNYYSIFVELRPQFKSATGGFSSGMYLLMDENYKELDPVTLYPNEDPNHTHGEGYLDQHEFIMLGENHYLLLSYTQQEVNNLPASVKGINGSSRAYVWSGIMQEVKDGKVVNEINTADYPLLYESSVEKCDYAGSTLEGVDVAVGQQVIPDSYADGIQDYVHVNSLTIP